MFLPIGDEPNPRVTPYVNYLLIAANVAVFVLVSLPLMGQAPDVDDPLYREYLRFLAARFPSASPGELLRNVSAYDLFTFRHGFRPATPELSDLFASLFLHGGLMHLAGNMLFLYIYGDNVEARLGRLRYLLVYLGTGVAATLFFAVFQLDSHTPLVGASGAISGVLGCYFLWFPSNRIRVLVLLFYYFDVWRVPARWVLGFYLVLDNLLPFLVQGDAGGVAHGAHIGGFLGGLGVAWLMRGMRPRLVEPGARRGESAFRAPAYERPPDEFRRAVRGHSYEQAADLYARMAQSQRNELADEDVMTLAEALARGGHADLALAILQRFMATRQESPALPFAHLAAGVIQLDERGQLTAAREHFLAALALSPPEAVAEAARAGLRRIAELQQLRP